MWERIPQQGKPFPGFLQNLCFGLWEGGPLLRYHATDSALSGQAQMDPGPKRAMAQVGVGSAQVGQGPKRARAQVSPGPSGPGPKCAQMGTGPKRARAQVML